MPGPGGRAFRNSHEAWYRLITGTMETAVKWRPLFFSLKGRIGRQHWWLGNVALLAVIGVASVLLAAMFGTRVAPEVAEVPFEYDLGPTGGAVLIVLILAYAWSSLALTVKRWHDRDKSGLWMLIAAVPVIGGIWALIENGFLKGTDGPNSYGNDPLAIP